MKVLADFQICISVPLKAKAHNLKWYFLRWSFKVFKLLFTYIYLSLASLSVLFKRKSIDFVNLSLFLHEVSIFWLEHFHILPKHQRPAFKLHVLWWKTGIHYWNHPEKVSLMYENSFPILLLCNLKYISFYLSILAWKAPASSWFPSDLAMSLKINLQCFGPFGKFQNTKEISM